MNIARRYEWLQNYLELTYPHIPSDHPVSSRLNPWIVRVEADALTHRLCHSDDTAWKAPWRHSETQDHLSHQAEISQLIFLNLTDS